MGARSVRTENIVFNHIPVFWSFVAVTLTLYSLSLSYGETEGFGSKVTTRSRRPPAGKKYPGAQPTFPSTVITSARSSCDKTTLASKAAVDQLLANCK